MKKMFSIVATLFFATGLFAANTVNMKLGNFDVTAIQIQSMNHKKELFRYKDSEKLKEFLNQKDSTASAINVFYVDMGEHKVLFDTGISAPALLEALKIINVDPKTIDVICITHMHYDHIAGLINDYNRTFPKADICIAQEELDANKTSDILLAYPNRIKPFTQDEKILPPYIQSIPAFGHTLGHTMYEITSEGETMLIWGDILHAPIQFQDPNIYLVYDTDPIQALSVRKQVMQDYADTDKYIAGAHLLNCGIGKLQKDGSGYKFVFYTK